MLHRRIPILLMRSRSTKLVSGCGNSDKHEKAKGIFLHTRVKSVPSGTVTLSVTIIIVKAERDPPGSVEAAAVFITAVDAIASLQSGADTKSGCSCLQRATLVAQFKVEVGQLHGRPALGHSCTEFVFSGCWHFNNGATIKIYDVLTEHGPCPSSRCPP